jgi:phosphodiesterase/alkaline phosphatase D-like protein
MKRSLTILGFLFLYIIPSQAQELTFRSITYRPDGILAKEPVVTELDKSEAIVEFETLIPTPEAVVYYGVIPPEEELAYPRYRKLAKELLPTGTTRTTTHQLRLDISKLESVYYDTGLIANGGGVIAYRIEVYDPRINAAQHYDRQFRYQREGKPKTGKYTLHTSLTAGPFVDLVTPKSAVISWETEPPSNGAVWVNNTEVKSGEISAHHEVLLTGLTPSTQYTYRVQYASAGGITREYSFRTGPTPRSRRAFKFGFMSDSRGGVGGGERAQNGVNVKDLGQFAAALYRKNVDFICFGGDLVNGYTTDQRDFESQLETWKRAIQPVAARIPVYEAMGNHEQLGNYYKVLDPINKGQYFIMFSDGKGKQSAETSFAKAFVNPQGSVYGFEAPPPEVRALGVAGPETGPTYVENVYSFNYQNVHFVSLNSNYWATGFRHIEKFGQDNGDKGINKIALEHLGGNREGYLRSNQLKWLERDLQSAQADPNIDWVFIYIHEPAFPNGGHVRDAMYWGTSGKGELGGYNEPDDPLGDVIDMRDRFWKILAKSSKVLAVLSGDEHNYSRTRIDSDVHPDYQIPIWQIISGGCGAPYYVQDKSVPWVEKVEAFSISKNYCLFTVDGRRVGLTVHSDTDQTLDSVADLTTIK